MADWEKQFFDFHNLSIYGSRIVPRMFLGHFRYVKHIFDNFGGSKMIFVMILAS